MLDQRMGMIFAPYSTQIEAEIEALAKSLYDMLANREWEFFLTEQGSSKYKKIFRELFKKCQLRVRVMAEETEELKAFDFSGKRKETFQEICEQFEVTLKNTVKVPNEALPQHIVRGAGEIALAMKNADKAFCLMFGIGDEELT